MVGLSGEHDHDRVGPLLPDSLEQLDPGHVGEADVEEDQLRGLALERSNGGLAGLGRRDLEPLCFQIARQEENESLPPFRREMSEAAYTEGWGEYAAYLGTEMGLYQDPYDRAGRLMMDAMLSTRLVVDTGMNALGWSRRRAMEYMRANTMLSDTEIATETLRYAVDIPAQALAYKIGSLKMIELRALAQRELGARFDVRQFHEWIIGSGSMPLDVLEEHVRHEMSASAASK